ncbi:MAG: hypothetical protein JO142_20260, partial [Burkholderiales bacterium]|nr:hypothetical protein [Burkholderiales bacterium]
MDMDKFSPTSIRAWLIWLVITCVVPATLATLALFYASYRHARSNQIESNVA